jgi:hypothetical protein
VPESQTYNLRVIPEPEPGTATVMVLLDDAECFVRGTGAGKGPYTFLCGSCGKPLIIDVRRHDTVSGLVIKCNKCGAFNQTLG